MKVAEIPGKKILEAFENLSVGAGMLSRRHKRSQEIWNEIANSTFYITKKKKRQAYHINLSSNKATGLARTHKIYAWREWTFVKDRGMKFTQISGGRGYGKFINLGTIYYLMSLQQDKAHPLFRNAIIDELTPEACKFWAKFLGFNKKKDFVMYVLETDGASCTFLHEKNGVVVQNEVVASEDDLEALEVSIKDVGTNIGYITIPYPVLVDRIKNVWGYPEKRRMVRLIKE